MKLHGFQCNFVGFTRVTQVLVEKYINFSEVPLNL